MYATNKATNTQNIIYFIFLLIVSPLFAFFHSSERFLKQSREATLLIRPSSASCALSPK